MSKSGTQDTSTPTGASPSPPPRRAPLVADSHRIVLADVQPQVESGRYPIRRVVGETVRIQAEVLCDGDKVRRACILYRTSGESRWRPAPMQADESGVHWQGTLRLQNGGSTLYCVEAWIDVFATWQRRLRSLLRDSSRPDALGEWVRDGVGILHKAMESASGADLRFLATCADALQEHAGEAEFLKRWARDRELNKRMLVHGERLHVVRSQPPLEVVAERKRAAYSTWSRLDAVPEAEGALSELLHCGIDILHHTSEGSGSPWPVPPAVQGLETAVDFPLPEPLDADWQRRHPEWFVRDAAAAPMERPARVDLWCADREALWDTCLDVALDRIRRGARTLVAPNASQVPLPFWEWLVQRVHKVHPEVMFVSGPEGPEWARALSRRGFSQTRIPWNGTLPQAIRDVTLWAASGLTAWRPCPEVPAQPETAAPAPPVAWHELRLVQLIAATATGCWGIRGVPRPDEALPWVQQLQHWRREHHALQGATRLALLPVSSPDLFAFSRVAPGERSALVLVVPRTADGTHEGTVQLPERFGGSATQGGLAFEDLLDGQRYIWRAGENYVRLHPQEHVAHVLRVVRKPRLLV